jgi:hypothetical protein
VSYIVPDFTPQNLVVPDPPPFDNIADHEITDLEKDSLPLMIIKTELVFFVFNKLFCYFFT